MIDSPAAASLRPHQTLLYDEFEARLVRSRPYAIPDSGWLAQPAGDLARVARGRRRHVALIVLAAVALTAACTMPPAYEGGRA